MHATGGGRKDRQVNFWKPSLKQAASLAVFLPRTSASFPRTSWRYDVASICQVWPSCSLASTAAQPIHIIRPTSKPTKYTGTHDNNTTKGWWDDLEDETQQRVSRLLKPGEPPTEGLMRLARESRASMAIHPLQDVLGLGEEARMNTPGTFEGNWAWGFAWSDLPGGKNGLP